MRGARLIVLIALVVLLVLVIAFARACHSGTQNLEDDAERTTVSSLVLPADPLG